MKTGISEASKRVSIFSFATQRQASELLFSTEKLGPSPRGYTKFVSGKNNKQHDHHRGRSGFLQADLSLIV